MSNYVKARRAYSMPTRYCIPSAEMGEYEDGHRRHSAPIRPSSGPGSLSDGYERSSERKGSMLYPLSEEGAYGAPPRAPAAPKAAAKPPASGVPFQRIRERKPKVYSSYAVDSNCDVHSKKLTNAEKDAERSRRPSWASRRTSASPARRISSASPSRAGSRSRAASSDRGQRSNSPEVSSRTTVTTTRKYSAPAKTPG